MLMMVEYYNIMALVRGVLGLWLIKLIVIILKYSAVYNIASLLIVVLDEMIIFVSSYIPGFLRVGKTNSTAGVSQQLCLSYSVLTIFIASPFFSNSHLSLDIYGHDYAT